MLRARLQAWGLSDQFLCPQLPASPRAAFQLAQELIAASAAHTAPTQLAVIGSSLGGYYATALAEKLACRAVLLNPAVAPTQDLQRHIGVTTAWHSTERVDFKPEYIAELGELAVPAITQAQRYLLLAATGDEVLDWRAMAAHYPGAHQHIIQGSDHGLSDFDLYIDQVLQFCGVAQPHPHPHPTFSKHTAH